MTEPKAQLDPAAMTIADAIRVLVAAGSRQTSEDSIRADLESGLAANTDGTINLVRYTAWLVDERNDRAN